jgi:pyruvate kinase
VSTLTAKTKILATIGPAIDSREKLEAIVDAGVNGFRLNFSHGNFEYFERVFNTINELCVRKSLPIPILIDLQGPKIRIGELSQPEIYIASGDTIELTTEECLGTKEKISVSYKQLVDDSLIGETILIDDGLIRLQIAEKKIKSVVCTVIEGGVLKPKKGMNLPGMNLSTPSVTEKDFKNLEFALKHRVDYIALSFVRKAEDIVVLRSWLTKRGFKKPIIAKIEKQEAVNNFEEILHAADGIMVARGDLGVELGPQEVPIIQKQIIKRCNEAGKLVITATQMLESMVNNPIPTRAEASDVANAVWDGTDVVMLSAETSVGKFPIRTVEIMKEIIGKAESTYHYEPNLNFEVPTDTQEKLFDYMNKSIVTMSRQINAKAILAFSSGGNTPSSLSKFRPQAQIIAITDNFDAMNLLSLRWGVSSIFFENINEKYKAVAAVKKILVEKKLVKPGEFIVFTEGGPKAENIRENWIRFEAI